MVTTKHSLLADDELAARSQHGDRQALEILIARYRPLPRAKKVGATSCRAVTPTISSRRRSSGCTRRPAISGRTTR